ncbi:MAG: hypothetical protein GXP16_06400 [Gammaproteobacteria bacterium]|nr:hypothetical protein [Gammaproteobacteria bacterium]
MYLEGTNWKTRLGNAGTTPSFSSEHTVANAATDPEWSTVADIYGDGLPDIAFEEADGDWVYRINNGDYPDRHNLICSNSNHFTVSNAHRD